MLWIDFAYRLQQSDMRLIIAYFFASLVCLCLCHSVTTPKCCTNAIFKLCIDKCKEKPDGDEFADCFRGCVTPMWRRFRVLKQSLVVGLPEDWRQVELFHSVGAICWEQCESKMPKYEYPEFRVGKKGTEEDFFKCTEDCIKNKTVILIGKKK
ncbi:unnamed protein product [Cylicostephanus goldi]|uniref:Uncharacterized protein n=1 Tax=Cylicostephanus goldi TaxID=71465 RepID=A0A3P6TEW1_CYLGO|nr:unnamed protein product [Cylicostephanus goldi]